MKRYLILLFTLLLLILARSPILTSLGNFLIVKDQLAPADFIVVLSGDTNGERVREAVSLYAKGLAPKLLLSGGQLAWELNAAEWMKVQAVRSGVPAQAIVLEKKSESTKENALFSSAILRKYQAKKIILVTSPTHTRRAKRAFRRLTGLKVLSWPVSQSRFQVKKWWTRHEDIQRVVWEYVSLIFYLFVV